MKQYNQNAHRGKSKQAVKRPISSHVANGPNEVWTWEVWEEETSEKASILIEKAVISQKLRGKPIVLHSGINYVTPKSRHEGKDKAILEKRKQLYEACKNKNPARWSKTTRDWKFIETVALNPIKEIENSVETA